MQEMGFTALLTLLTYRCCRGALGRTYGCQWRHSRVKAVMSPSQSAPWTLHLLLCSLGTCACVLFLPWLSHDGLCLRWRDTLPLPRGLGSKKAKTLGKTQQQSKKAPHSTEIKGLAGKEAATAAWVSTAVQPTSTLLNHVPDCKAQTK